MDLRSRLKPRPSFKGCTYVPTPYTCSLLEITSHIRKSLSEPLSQHGVRYPHQLPSAYVETYFVVPAGHTFMNLVHPKQTKYEGHRFMYVFSMRRDYYSTKPLNALPPMEKLLGSTFLVRLCSQQYREAISLFSLHTKFCLHILEFVSPRALSNSADYLEAMAFNCYRRHASCTSKSPSTSGQTATPSSDKNQAVSPAISTANYWPVRHAMYVCFSK